MHAYQCLHFHVANPLLLCGSEINFILSLKSLSNEKQVYIFMEGDSLCSLHPLSLDFSLDSPYFLESDSSAIALSEIFPRLRPKECGVNPNKFRLLCGVDPRLTHSPA